ncbi:MAG TPA: hypothetical protein VEB43_21730 [Anaeromyxobacter sp.]|nr:hypothetical protein [Anaeromyxobacter sp.]
MEYAVCPRCRLRYLPTNDAGCPCCPAERGAASTLAPQGAAHPPTDFLVVLLHLFFAATLLLTFFASTWVGAGPVWALAGVALDLATAVGAAAHWRSTRLLAKIRAVFYFGVAAVLLHLELGSAFAFLALVAHTIAVWTVFPRGAFRDGEAVPLGYAGVAGIGTAAAIGEVARSRAGWFWIRLMLVLAAVLTWLPFLGGLPQLALPG